MPAIISIEFPRGNWSVSLDSRREINKTFEESTNNRFTPVKVYWAASWGLSSNSWSAYPSFSIWWTASESIRCYEEEDRKMDGNCLNLENPITDAVSRIRFAPQSNNLLISSWDSVTLSLSPPRLYFFLSISEAIFIKSRIFFSYLQMLRLYDVSSSVLRLEAPSEAALLSCCFQEETVAFSVGSDCCVRRCGPFIYPNWIPHNYLHNYHSFSKSWILSCLLANWNGNFCVLILYWIDD